MKFLHWFHKWGKWQEEGRYKISVQYKNSSEWIEHGYEVIQKRECAECGLVKRIQQKITV